MTRLLLSLALLAAHSSATAHAQASRTPDAIGVARAALTALDVAACVPETLPATAIELALVVYPNGRWAFAVGPVTWPGHRVGPEHTAPIRTCLEAALSQSLPWELTQRRPRRASLVTRSWTAPPTAAAVAPTQTAEPHDGRDRAICRWGEHRPDAMTLPEPRACRAGLVCCSAGGAAGSDSICMQVSGHCPAYP